MFARYRLPLLAGALIGSSYIPFPPWALFFSVAPLWVFSMRSSSLKEVVMGGWLTQFVLNLIGFHWFAQAAMETGHFSWFGGVVSLLAFAATAHLYFPASLAVWFLLNRRFPLKKEGSVLLIATLLALFMNLFPTLFPWHFGHPWLWVGLPGSQIADWIGFEGLSYVTLLINGAFALAWLRWPNRKDAIGFATVGITILIFVNALGLANKPSEAGDAKLEILAIQGNIGNLEKIEAEKGAASRATIVQRYEGHTRKGLAAHPDVDLVIWPETAFPYYLDTDLSYDVSVAELASFLRSIDKPLLTGAFSRDPATKVAYNSVAALEKNGSFSAGPVYRKTILMPFGEYVPGSSLFPSLKDALPGVSSWGEGSGPIVLRQASWKFGPQICYEGLFPWFSKRLADSGAEIFVNLTNDAWFGGGFEMDQHLYLTLGRSIEFRRPMIRATNTGVTTAILSDGTVLESSPRSTEWFGVFEIPFRRDPPLTLYSYLLPFWPWLLALFGGMTLVFGRSKEFSPSPNPS